MQGEGPSLGRRCAFVRLGGCNLSCRWCDTPYTWDWKGVADSGVAYSPGAELHTVHWRDVLDRLTGYGVPMVVVSGGEPLGQQRRLVPLLRALAESGHAVEIETNGTVVPDPDVAERVRFNVSPKLAHSGDRSGRRIVPRALRAFSRLPGTAFKFVCRDSRDLDEVAEVAGMCDAESVWIMPEGRTADEIHRTLRILGDEVIERGWNLTTRLHVTLWDNRRGV
ncbi:7-carboxy-7-deazaguanine synthase QueE [Streptomyces acidiscabies]|uniref:7-carboxy-7-deazaguanine synthase n=1 Tax=Streptomyces acidiscabies TaxID=42234 RepID=A0A0L0JIE8_9ACTN|nr:7-carboxy-7-deazaguanine synthase QueE [Streptomyces acidiscabies]MBP5935522.1 7-carboxy-7-deazaguanine synthase QueE [Streptomyces sp. LBUM 1476]KND25234.1 radical SAM protein [Streptomyces acidiscabies]MBZ3916605.1 7-carboxy-7-deazaguanine synthase QueE [Streptomyces acidiscabies]MDX2966880.1 7-carboxy-7-deazaguanine synthase QueE [Streptomyces acidiscabies]MDX3020283.1 7-carboxy-7-deazaguanine synthase QueE [Streptomyces acidiscabies]